MALEGSEWGIIAGVFAVVVAVMLFYNLRAKDATPAAGGRESSAASPSGSPTDPLLMKFAHHEGSVVGETVALSGDDLILKQAGVFKAVPRRQAQVEGGDVMLSGDIDWEGSIAGGTAWLQANRAGQDDAVTADLTTSDDVKAPALAAFEKRRDPDDSEE